MAKILRLPDRGVLIVCTDLQGCLRDYHRIVDVFVRRMADHPEGAHLLFTGDLIHGPYIEPDEWPEFLGEYYHDESGPLIDELLALREDYPGRVHALLGNHEHGHIGGPHTAKFARDEVAVLERILGPRGSARLRGFLSRLPLVALAPCGAVFTHGAPAAEIESLQEIETAQLALENAMRPPRIIDVPVIGPLLWARSAPSDIARDFLRVVGGTISIYGHDVIPEGFDKVGDEQIVVSTSFGVFDSHKVYLELDLAQKYQTVHDLRIGHEIQALYPALAIPELCTEAQ